MNILYVFASHCPSSVFPDFLFKGYSLLMHCSCCLSVCVSVFLSFLLSFFLSLCLLVFCAVLPRFPFIFWFTFDLWELSSLTVILAFFTNLLSHAFSCLLSHMCFVFSACHFMLHTSPVIHNSLTKIYVLI